MVLTNSQYSTFQYCFGRNLIRNEDLYGNFVSEKRSEADNEDYCNTGSAIVDEKKISLLETAEKILKIYRNVSKYLSTEVLALLKRSELYSFYFS